MAVSLTQRIKEKAHDLGFELVGVAPVEPVPELAFYRDWIEAGYAGRMDYLKRQSEKKRSVTNVVPEATSVIACAKIYHTDHPLSVDIEDKSRAWISRYAWGDDYHDFLQKKLFELIEFLKSESDEPVIAKAYVDTGPVVDRVYAKYAGIGWFGKNTCIINQRVGSWFFLGEIVTNLELAYDAPVPDRCGTCSRCIEACPTDAIVEPYVLDARLCISYLTIELRGAIPEALRDLLGNHVFGCDICQDVCPWNSKAQKSGEAAFEPREGLFAPELEALARLDEGSYQTRFRGSAVKRSKFQGFLRNVAVAMGNSKSGRFLPVLKELAEYAEPGVAEHAEWSIRKILKNKAKHKAAN